MQRGGIAILLFAGASRLLRAGLRWDEWSLHYAAYNLTTQEALQTNGALEATQVWAGLHPPLYPLIHSALSILWPSPSLWLLFSAMCGVGSVYFLLRAHPGNLLPAFLLATDPVHLHYTAEVNNYPMAVLLVSGAWWALRTDKPRLLALFACLGVWTHIMAGFVCGLIAVSHRKRWPILAILGTLSLPLLGAAWALASDPGSQRQPPLNLELSIQDAIDRFGLAWLALIPMLALGATRAKDAAGLWVGTTLFWVFMVSLGLAAPHQFPYALFLGVPAAVLLAATAKRHRNFLALIIAIGTLRGTWSVGGSIKQAHEVYEDQNKHRAIDEVLNLSLPGDAIVLVRGPGAPDDDKRHASPTLWRLSPFEPMPPVFTSVRPDLVGQPRLYRGRRIYTFSHPRPSIATIPGQSVFTILYDGAEHNIGQIPNHDYQGAWTRTGPDLWRGPKAITSTP